METGDILEKIKIIEQQVADLSKKQGGGTTIEKASSVEIKAGVDDAKYPTSKGLKDAGITGWLVNQVFN